ncbi:MAG: FAD:protein FMN transferase [Pseudomonadota bacterium]
MKKIILVIIVILIVAGLFYFNKGRQEAVFYPMGGIPFKVIAYDRSRLEFRKDLQAVKQRVEDLELIFNSYLSQSEISQLNQTKQLKPVVMSSDLERVLLASKKWWAKTQGAFDITVGPLIKLWEQAGKNKQLPSALEIEQALQKIGSAKFKINGKQIIFTKPQMNFGLGGIAKGDIIDQIIIIMQMRGIKQGVVDAGGDIRAFGPGKFNFGLKNPIPDSSEILGKVKISAGAIVTSGNYERFSEINGKKFSHIIDPRTGWPVDNSLVSVTVIADQAINADAVATALMVLGKDKALDFFENNKEFSGILVEKNGNYSVWVSADLKSNFELEKPYERITQRYF